MMKSYSTFNCLCGLCATKWMKEQMKIIKSGEPDLKHHFNIETLFGRIYKLNIN